MAAVMVAAEGAFDPDGPVAREMAELWWLMLGLGTAVFVVVIALLGAGLVRRRGGRGEAAPPSSETVVRRWVVLGGVAMPLVVLVVVLGATIRTMREVDGAAPGEPLVVEVVGHQWWWEVHYPEQGLTTANELHLPVGRPVELRLTSADVIHSFWVPALGGKLDLLPDGVNTLVLQADEADEHASHCAEFCGLQHANMGLTVVAEPPDAFAAWVAERAAPAAAPADAAAERGLDVFLDAGCADCHAIDGTEADGTEGPDLSHLASRPSLGALATDNTPDQLARWVTDPHSIKTGVLMPAASLSDQDRDALLAYLGGLR